MQVTVSEPIHLALTPPPPTHPASADAGHRRKRGRPHGESAGKAELLPVACGSGQARGTSMPPRRPHSRLHATPTWHAPTALLPPLPPHPLHNNSTPSMQRNRSAPPTPTSWVTQVRPQVAGRGRQLGGACSRVCNALGGMRPLGSHPPRRPVLPAAAYCLAPLPASEMPYELTLPAHPLMEAASLACIRLLCSPPSHLPLNCTPFPSPPNP